MESRALVMESPGELRQRLIEIPDPGPTDVLLRIETTGICGTDVEMNHGSLNIDFPVVPGHEFVGVVEEVGEAIETDASGQPISPGDRLSVVPAMCCGECWYCENVPTRPPLCENRLRFGFENVEQYAFAGGMSERVVLPQEATYYQLPDDMPTDLGALVEPLSCGMHAFERTLQPGLPHVREGFGIGQSVAVQGAGPIGILTVSTAKAAGADSIIIVDPMEDRLEMAREFGATDTVAPEPDESTAELVDRVSALTPGNVGPDIVIEAAGVPQAFGQSLLLPRDGGTVIEMGHFASSGEIDVDPAVLVRSEIDLYGSLAYPPSQFESAISLLDQLRAELPFEDLFNHRAGFDDADEAFEAQAEGTAFRATIHPHQ